jgi:hypothetical protein
VHFCPLEKWCFKVALNYTLILASKYRVFKVAHCEFYFDTSFSCGSFRNREKLLENIPGQALEKIDVS